MHQTPPRLLQRDRLLDHAVDIATAQPFVSELGSAVQVYRRDDAHVGLSPFPTAVRSLRFEQLERVETEVGLGDLERFAEDGAGFVLHEEQRAMGFPLGDFLEQTKEVDVCEEESGCVIREGRLRQSAGGRVAEFIDFGAGGR